MRIRGSVGGMDFRRKTSSYQRISTPRLDSPSGPWLGVGGLVQYLMVMIGESTFSELRLELSF